MSSANLAVKRTDDAPRAEGDRAGNRGTRARQSSGDTAPQPRPHDPADADGLRARSRSGRLRIGFQTGARTRTANHPKEETR